MKRIRLASLFLSMALVVTATSAFGAEKSRSQWKREKIDVMEKSTMDRLFAEQKGAKSLYDMSYGYAVFSSVKVMFGISGGGGSGVAIVRNSGQRVYMKMGTGGLGIGLGGQKASIVFLFQDKATMEDFINNGWQGDAAANAVAGTQGANAATSFTKGMAIYQLTESGLMLKADAAGTKYWVDKKLNKTQTTQTLSSAPATSPGVVNVSSEPIEPQQ